MFQNLSMKGPRAANTEEVPESRCQLSAAAHSLLTLLAAVVAGSPPLPMSQRVSRAEPVDDARGVFSWSRRAVARKVLMKPTRSRRRNQDDANMGWCLYNYNNYYRLPPGAPLCPCRVWRPCVCGAGRGLWPNALSPWRRRQVKSAKSEIALISASARGFRVIKALSLLLRSRQGSGAPRRDLEEQSRRRARHWRFRRHRRVPTRQRAGDATVASVWGRSSHLSSPSRDRRAWFGPRADTDD
ncbi:hypothetical protein CDD83_9671 [Cordyceps sp. RAO-2017]|nr:hypothetical protein CDD83_9671 [Cordyceps sp. RAO-2017]